MRENIRSRRGRNARRRGLGVAGLVVWVGGLGAGSAATAAAPPGNRGVGAAPEPFASSVDEFIDAVNDSAARVGLGAPAALSADIDAQQIWITGGFDDDPFTFVSIDEPRGVVIGGGGGADGAVTGVVVGADAEFAEAVAWMHVVVAATTSEDGTSAVVEAFGEGRSLEVGEDLYVADAASPGRGFVIRSLAGLTSGDPLTFVAAVAAADPSSASTEAEQLIEQVMAVRLAYDLRADSLTPPDSAPLASSIGAAGPSRSRRRWRLSLVGNNLTGNYN